MPTLCESVPFYKKRACMNKKRSQTEIKIIKAVFSLVEKDPAKPIYIRTICEEAGVSKTPSTAVFRESRIFSKEQSLMQKN